MSRFTVTADASGAVKAVQDLGKAISENVKGFEEATKKADRFDKAAQRITRNNEGPQERYNRKIAELAELVNRGKLSVDQAQLAAVKYNATLEKTATTTKQAFGSDSLNNLRGFAAQFVTIQTALNGALAAFRDLQAEKERVAQAEMAAVGGMGALSQLAATAGDKQAQERAMLEYEAEARGLAGIGAASSLNEAAQLIFSLNSAGLNKEDRAFAAALKGAGVMSDLGGASTAFSALQTAMGSEEVGSFRDFMSKALAASAVAPAQANEIAQATSGAGASLRTLGLTDEFGYSATAVLSKVAGNAAQGGTLLEAFLKQVEKSGLDIEGKTGVEIVKLIGGLSEEEQGIGGVLGDRAEAVKGFRILRDNVDMLSELEKSVAAAPANDLANRAIELTDVSTGLRAAKARQAAEGRRDTALQGDAELTNMVAAAFAERQRTARADAGMFTELNLALEKGQIKLVGALGTRQEKLDILQEYVDEGAIQDQSLLKDIRSLLTSNVTTRQE